MTWESPDERRRRVRDRLLVAALLLVVAWSTFAFGAVYPWAYVPLLVGCSAIGLACLVPRRGGTPRLANSAPAWLAVLGVGALLQLVPVPATLLRAISPATDAFLRSQHFSYAAAAVSPETAGQLWHPLSLAPGSTWLALAFLTAFTLLLAGVTRWLRPSHVRVIGPALVAIGVGLALVGIAQKALGAHEMHDFRIYGVWKPVYDGNVFGPFVNRNHFAGWMVMVLPLALAYFAATLGEALSGIGGGWRNRVLWVGSERAGQALTTGFAVVVMIVSVVYSGSRSGIACAAFVVVAMGWLAVRASIRKTARVGVAAVFGLLIVGGLAWAGGDLMLQRFTLVPAEIGDRVGTWKDALRVIRDFPVFGVGLNAYHAASLLYQTVASAWQYQSVHNDYLQLAAEGGVLLTVPAVLAVLTLVRELRRRMRQQADDLLAGWLRTGAVVGLCAIALQSFVDFSLQIPANAVLLVVLASIAVHRRSTHAAPRRLEREIALTSHSA